MLGKASEIKTRLVLETAGSIFDDVLNHELDLLEESQIINIQFSATADSNGEAWFNALIIYKEGSNGYPSP